MKKFMVLFVLFSSAALAQEPAYVYQQFGYSPKQYEGNGLAKDQQSELDGCIKAARVEDESWKKNAEFVSTLYGKQALEGDHYGLVLTTCLGDEKHGKGWTVQEKNGDTWKNVTPYYASRVLMKLDPTK